MDSQRLNGMEFYPLKVVSYTPETEDSASFAFEIPSHLADTFAYQAGQFLTFRIPWQDFFIERCYSLSSSPITDTVSQVTVKRVADGRVSNWFNDQLRTNSEILVAPPSGRFLLRNNGTNDLILFAGGSGITPILSIIKTVLQTTNRNIQLIYANRDLESVIFKQTLDDLLSEHSSRFSCHHHFDKEQGFLTREIIEPVVAERWHADFYICGPGPFMDLVEDVLESHQVDNEQIAIERFVSSLDPDRREQETAQEQSSVNGTTIEKAAFENIALKVTASGKDHQTTYLNGKTLLESVLADPELAEDIPFSCQEGHCGSCMAILKKGEVKMRANRVLSKRDLAKGYVLACQSDPASDDIWLDFDI